jgi:hypothetical protein
LKQKETAPFEAPFSFRDVSRTLPLIFNDFCVLSASRHDMARDMDDMDQAPDRSLRKARQAVLDHLTDTDEPQSIAEIVAGTGADKNAIDQALHHLVDTGDVIIAAAIAGDHDGAPTYTLPLKPSSLAVVPPQPVGGVLVPDGFLPLSSAANILESKMWGGLPPPKPVEHIKEELGKKLSVGWWRWRVRARKDLRAAAIKGKLQVLVVAFPGADPVPVPAKVLKQLITSRGQLSDHPVPLPPLSVVKAGGGDEKLYALMKTGILIVNGKEFEAWCRSEGRRGKWPSQWPSQWSRSKRPEGRPSKRTDKRLREAVLACVKYERWNGRMSIPSLHRALRSDGLEISEDALSGLVDQLFDEIGDSRLRRRVKYVKTTKGRFLPQN